MNYNCEELKELLSHRLCEKRAEHSLFVAQAAEKLANIFGENSSKAYYTGLLHDICKDDPKEEQLQTIKNSAIIWDGKALLQPALWHAMAGSLVIQKELNIADGDMINAVRYHTTARSGMSRLEKIIYLADLTSEDRTYPDVDVVRALSYASLEKAMFHSLQFIMSDLIARKMQIVTDTFEAYNEYAR